MPASCKHRRNQNDPSHRKIRALSMKNKLADDGDWCGKLRARASRRISGFGNSTPAPPCVEACTGYAPTNARTNVSCPLRKRCERTPPVPRPSSDTFPTGLPSQNHSPYPATLRNRRQPSTPQLQTRRTGHSRLLHNSTPPCWRELPRTQPLSSFSQANACHASGSASLRAYVLRLERQQRSRWIQTPADPRHALQRQPELHHHPSNR